MGTLHDQGQKKQLKLGNSPKPLVGSQLKKNQKAEALI